MPIYAFHAVHNGSTHGDHKQHWINRGTANKIRAPKIPAKDQPRMTSITGAIDWNHDATAVRIGKTNLLEMRVPPLIARFMGPTWGPSGANRTQVGPMLAPWTLLYGLRLENPDRAYAENTSHWSAFSMTLWSQLIWYTRNNFAEIYLHKDRIDISYFRYFHVRIKTYIYIFLQ